MKSRFLETLSKNGDSIVEFKDRSEPIGCTVDFNNKYIKSIKKPFLKDFNKGILVFSWTDNQYKLLEPENIWKITPLAKVLNNV